MFVLCVCYVCVLSRVVMMSGEDVCVIVRYRRHLVNETTQRVVTDCIRTYSNMHNIIAC